MYQYVENKELIHAMRQLCGNIMQDLCHTLKKESKISARFDLIGSGGRNLIMQNVDQPIDLDYNLEIINCDSINDGRYVKEQVRKAFNKALKNYGWGDCKDSTSVLTTEKRYFPDISNTEFSMDVCIVQRDQLGNYNRLIHSKTGCAFTDQYYWNMARDTSKLQKKVKWLKQENLWIDVREEYKNIKNSNLRNSFYVAPSKSSFECYAEAVNNIYNRHNNVYKQFRTAYLERNYNILNRIL